MRGYPECGEGWRDLLERACLRIEAALAEDSAFAALQIKEKYGTLRFYWRGHLTSEEETKVEEAIDLAVARSACTCEICGTEGRLHNRGGGLATACVNHAEGEPASVRPGFENLHIVRRFTAGGLETVSCRRYDRSTDSFADIDPDSLGIEEK
jgi:hypothetical protein